MLEVEQEEKPMDLWFTYVSKINSCEKRARKIEHFYSSLCFQAQTVRAIRFHQFLCFTQLSDCVELLRWKGIAESITNRTMLYPEYVRNIFDKRRYQL